MKKFGKRGLEDFEQALKKGRCRAKGEAGIKFLSGKGIQVGKMWYKFELKVKGKFGDWRIYGNIDKLGKIIFDKIAKGDH